MSLLIIMKQYPRKMTQQLFLTRAMILPAVIQNQVIRKLDRTPIPFLTPRTKVKALPIEEFRHLGKVIPGSC
jgi:hypothetical protein